MNVVAKSDLEALFETVVNGGYCIGCGACASVNNSPIKMQLDDYGKLHPVVDGDTDKSSITAKMMAVCPFSEKAANEDKISKELFQENCKHDKRIGYYISTYAGFVSEGDFRENGSSGGIGTWIVNTLLVKGLVDGVIHVSQRQPSETDPRLFQYQLSTTTEQVIGAAKSRYYPVELSQVMQIVRERPGRYAIVGIPCFIKAVRLLMKQDALLSERISFCVGLICGHLKSLQFAQMLAWQCGIEPENLLEINFRKKLPNKNANQYGLEFVGLKGEQLVTTISPSVYELYGTDWGLGFFKYKACDYCDDIVAETADITIGDAWLPQYNNDSKGTNVVIVRHPVLQNIIEQSINEGSLTLDRIGTQDIVTSQDANFRHRRTGLAYRLHLAKNKGEWYPPKRVKPSYLLSPRIKKRQIMRILMAEKSHIFFKEAVDAHQFSLFVNKMESLIRRYRKTYQYPEWRKVVGSLKRFIMSLFK